MVLGSGAAKVLLLPIPNEYEFAPGITHVGVLAKSDVVTLLRTSELPGISGAVQLTPCTRLPRVSICAGSSSIFCRS